MPLGKGRELQHAMGPFKNISYVHALRHNYVNLYIHLSGGLCTNTVTQAIFLKTHFDLLSISSHTQESSPDATPSPTSIFLPTIQHQPEFGQKRENRGSVLQNSHKNQVHDNS